jgi:hypothetical protein
LPKVRALVQKGLFQQPRGYVPLQFLQRGFLLPLQSRERIFA